MEGTWGVCSQRGAHWPPCEHPRSWAAGSGGPGPAARQRQGARPWGSCLSSPSFPGFLGGSWGQWARPPRACPLCSPRWPFQCHGSPIHHRLEPLRVSGPRNGGRLAGRPRSLTGQQGDDAQQPGSQSGASGEARGHLGENRQWPRRCPGSGPTLSVPSGVRVVPSRGRTTWSPLCKTTRSPRRAPRRRAGTASPRGPTGQGQAGVLRVQSRVSGGSSRGAGGQEGGCPVVLGVGRVLGGEVVLGAEGEGSPRDGNHRAVSISGDDGGLAGREWRVEPRGEAEGPPETGTAPRSSQAGSSRPAAPSSPGPLNARVAETQGCCTRRPLGSQGSSGGQGMGSGWESGVRGQGRRRGLWHQHPEEP